MNGAELIAAERVRQIKDEHFDSAHDDRHWDAELAEAAMAYLHEGIARQGDWVIWPKTEAGYPPDHWPWEEEAWKPSADPIRNLVKAGALIVAEIDRLLRK